MSTFKDIVVCKFAGCNQIYNDARILPCGNRTCFAHIEAMTLKSDRINTAQRALKCHFCEEIHTFPDDGKEFPVDTIILLLLSMEHCKEHVAAKKSFNELTRVRV